MNDYQAEERLKCALDEIATGKRPGYTGFSTSEQETLKIGQRLASADFSRKSRKKEEFRNILAGRLANAAVQARQLRKLSWTGATIIVMIWLAVFAYSQTTLQDPSPIFFETTLQASGPAFATHPFTNENLTTTLAPRPIPTPIAPGTVLATTGLKPSAATPGASLKLP